MAGKKILVFIDWFAPGYKAGGPIRSAVNFVKHMKADYQLFVVTTDRDLGELSPYAGIPSDKWTVYEGDVAIMYCSPEKLSKASIRLLIDEVNPAIIYLNGMFSKVFTIYPLLISRQSGWPVKVILLPHGMLKDSALQFKAFKKKVFLAIFKLLGFHRHIIFQATDETEYRDVKDKLGDDVEVVLAPNLPDVIPPCAAPIAKANGELKVIFIGRVHPIKNLDLLLHRLADVQGKILLTVVGSEEDKEYAAKCKQIAHSFPDNITTHFEGEKAHHELAGLIRDHHIFALPTKGENFGYAIFEALALGKPALISDQTPWKGLQEEKAGWALPLQKPELFNEALQEAVDFDNDTYSQWSVGAWNYVNEKIRIDDLKIIYQKLFN